MDRLEAVMDILRINIKSLIFFLLWHKDDMSLNGIVIMSLVQLSVIFLSSIQPFASVIYQCIVGIEDINIVIESIIGLGDFCGFMFIYICFQVNLPKIKEIIKKASIFLNYCDLNVVEEAEKEVQLYTKGLMIYFSMGLTVNAVLPMLNYKNCNEKRLSDYYRMHDPCGMPTRTWVPFEVKTSPLYYFLVALHTNACIHISCTVLCVTMTLIGLLIHITAQIKNLKKHLLVVFNTEYEENDDESDSTVTGVEEKLKFCVKYHITIIEYTNEVFGAFNLLLIVHVCLTSMILGIIGYQIVAVEDFIDKLRYFLHLMGWVGLLFLTCYYGQSILNESASIADIAYQSKWYKGPVHLRKIICLIIARSQRPLKLRAASIGVISLETFVSVIKTAYSYFALLLSVAK